MLLMVCKLLVDTNLSSVSKHLVDTKNLASMKMLTDLTYLPDLTIYEELNRIIFFRFFMGASKLQNGSNGNLF